MKLFNVPLLRRRSANFEVTDETINAATEIIKRWVWSLKNTDLSKTKEVSAQGPFLTKIFQDCLGYVQQGGGEEVHHLVAELSIKQDAADAGLGFYTSTLKTTIAVVELKDAETSLDKKQLSRPGKETPVEQGFRYANKQDSCKWIIVSNFKEIRLYNKSRSQDYYESFKLEDLEDPVKFRQFYYLFSRDNLISESGPSVVDELLLRSADLSKEITDEFYAKYRDHRRTLFNDLTESNPQHGPTLLLEKAQKILDRLIFVCFCEDSSIRLLPSTTVKTIIEDAARSFEDREDKLWNQCRGLFRAIDQGMPNRVPPINAYNGGLFAQDAILDSLLVRDTVLKPVLDLHQYDFESDLDVNVLGYVFERSIADLESMKAEIDGVEVDKNTTKRKKDGIFYTPEYITRYIVENTIGAYIKEHPERLETLHILDPACGSGAFLNQAHNFLKNVYKTRRAELEAEALDQQEQAQLDAQKKSGKKRSAGVGGLFESTDAGLEVRRDLSNEWAYVNDGALLRHIYGVDLNEESVEITKLSLWLKTAKRDEPLRNLDNNIRVGNSLIDDPVVAKHRAFDWDAQFDTIKASGGFDIIIGNPPWVFARGGKLDPVDKAFYYKNFDTASYQINTYALFIEQSFRQLREGGKFAFIVPNTWLTIISFETLRRFLLEKTADLQIINIYGKVFEEANVDCCLLIYTKGTPNQVTLGEMRDQEIELFTPIDASTILGTDSAIMNISQYKSGEIDSVLESINDRSAPLTMYAKVSTGIKAYQIGKGKPAQTEEIKKGRVYHAKEKVDDTYVPYLEGVDVKRYQLDWTNKLWISYGDWLAEPRRSIQFDEPRILVRQIPSKPPYCISGAYTEKHYINDINSMVIFNFKIKPQAIMAVINSRLISYWFAFTFDKLQRGLFPQFKVKELGRFPVAKKIADYEDRFVTAVDTLSAQGSSIASSLLAAIDFLNANYGVQRKDASNALTRRDWDIIKPYLKNSTLTEKEEAFTYFSAKEKVISGMQTSLEQHSTSIDELVYEMYDLTEDEKAKIRAWN